MKLIQTATVGSGGLSTIEFASIPSTFTDVVLLMSLRTSQAGTDNDITIQFNSSTTGFTSRYLFGNGSSVGSGTQSTGILTVSTTSSGATASTFANASLYIPNYAGSTNKSYSLDHVNENNATFAYQILQAGLWSNTDAISNIKLLTTSGTFVENSRVSLYGILKGSDGIVTTS